MKSTIHGEVLAIRSVRWFASKSPDSIPTFLHLDLWPKQLTFQAPSTGLLPGVHLVQWKVASGRRLDVRREQWEYFSCAPNLPDHHGWLRTLLQSFSQATNLLLSLMPREAKGSLLLLVLGLVTIPCWFAKSCLNLWKWSLYLTPLDLPNWLHNLFPALSLVIKQMGRWRQLSVSSITCAFTWCQASVRTSPCMLVFKIHNNCLNQILLSPFYKLENWDPERSHSMVRITVGSDFQSWDPHRSLSGPKAVTMITFTVWVFLHRYGESRNAGKIK